MHTIYGIPICTLIFRQFTSAWNDYLFAIFLQYEKRSDHDRVLLGRWFIGGPMAGSVKS